MISFFRWQHGLMGRPPEPLELAGLCPVQLCPYQQWDSCLPNSLLKWSTSSGFLLWDDCSLCRGLSLRGVEIPWTRGGRTSWEIPTSFKSSHCLGFVVDNSFSSLKLLWHSASLRKPSHIKDESFFGKGISRPHPVWYLHTEEDLQDGWGNDSSDQEEQTGCGLILVMEPRPRHQDGGLAGGIPCLILIIIKLFALAASFLPSLTCN